MAAIRKATQKDIQILSRKLLQLLEDKNSQIYQENVTRFGVPEEYVRKAFAEETLAKAAAEGSAFYVAIQESEIVGFAQTIQQDADTTVLDRIIVFPEYARKGIGTQLLKTAIADQERKGTKRIIANAGKHETPARRFYEKNGFKLLKETTTQTPWGKKLELAIYQLQLESQES